MTTVTLTPTEADGTRPRMARAGRVPWAVALVVSCAAIVSLAALAEGTGPSIKFEKTTHDFGTIPSDQKQSFAWSYRNEGDAALEILATAPSCGCTASVAEPKRVA